MAKLIVKITITAEYEVEHELASSQIDELRDRLDEDIPGPIFIQDLTPREGIEWAVEPVQDIIQHLKDRGQYWHHSAFLEGFAGGE